MKIWELKPPGTLWVTQGLLRDSFFYAFPEGYHRLDLKSWNNDDDIRPKIDNNNE
jgi:hypothetical protein